MDKTKLIKAIMETETEVDAVMENEIDDYMYQSKQLDEALALLAEQRKLIDSYETVNKTLNVVVLKLFDGDEAKAIKYVKSLSEQTQ